MAEEEKILTEETEEVLTVSELVFEWSGALFWALAIVLLILTFGVRQVTVSGKSMTDTLQDADRLLVTNFIYTPQNGDIVVISHGSSYDQPIIKRVIAVEGQRLEINYENGDVAVDGVLQHEPYIKGVTRPLSDPLSLEEYGNVIPKGYVFVMGDNREGSLDSRSNEIGLIPLNNIIGKAQWRIMPFDSFGTVYYNMT